MKRIDVVPVAKPRMTQRDKWAKRPSVLRYRAFKDALRAAGVTRLPGILCIDFHLPMPASWSEKKKSEHRGEFHRQRPDIDNLVKGFMDAVGRDDCHVYRIDSSKMWADTGCIVLSDL